ncbi:phosphatidylethanolamine N-methyltransferase, partial [Spiromyces aspiralis]
DGSVVPLDEAKLDRVLKDLDLLAMVTDKTSSVRNLFNDTKNMITQATTKFAERSIPFELAKVPHLSHYQIQLQPSAISGGTCGAEVMPASGSPLSESDTKNLAGTRPSYVLGEPIRVSWCVPATHSQKDWIGVYPVTANPSDQLTIVSSWGRYVYIRPDRQLLMSIAPGDSIYASITKGTTYAPLTPLEEGRDGYDKERLGQADAVQLYYGEAVFSSHSLPWKVGIYEMRLHHATTHSVLRKSMAFEICAPDLWPQIPLPHTAEAVAKELLSLANRCLAETVMETSLSGTATPNSCSDPSASSTTINNLLAPLRVDIIKPLQSVRDRISIDNTLSEQQAKRLTYMVKVSFGVEFEPDVLIQAAKRSMTVLRVAERILKAKQTLETLSSTIIG